MAYQPTRRQQTFRVKAITVAVASCFAVSAEVAFAQAVLPAGGAVASGQVSPFVYKGNTLSITSQSNAVINWQTFSIGQNGKVIFYQPSAANSVLNRVIGVDPSSILGAMQSNGRVFLINPNGILFGAGAKIDVAGLVASTLNLSNADFLAGRMRFTETPGAGKIDNQGAITTPSGGQVYLIAPDVKNSGIITSPQGEVILAAGRSVEIVDAGTPTLRVEITAPDTQAVNIGQIIANGGKIGIFAGLIKNSGEIRADGVVVGQNGEILLKATNTVTLDNNSVISASGPTAGKITIQSDTGTVAVAGTVDANATQGTGGTINISAPQGITVDGRISATGGVTLNSAGPLTANAMVARPNEVVLTAPSVPLMSGTQIGVVATQRSGTLTVNDGSFTLNAGHPIVTTSGATGGTVNLLAAEGAIAVQGTIEVSSTGGRGGSINIIANSDITLDATSRILANGRAGGEVRVEATNGTLLAGGLIEGRGSDGPGGKVYLLAPRVALIRRALIDVTGDLGGGMALIGGDFQGRNPLIRNASRTYFGPDAVIRADAVTSGDGGKVIVWSDDGTQAYGTISARGGALSGNGGFVEISSKGWLDFAAAVDTSAPHGAFGTMLLDPYNLTIQAANPDLNGDLTPGDDLASGSLPFGAFAGLNSIITAGAVNTQLGLNGVVILEASNDLTVNAPIFTATPGRALVLQAGAQVNINADITTTALIFISANEVSATGARGAGNGGITMAPGTTLSATTALTGKVFLRVGAGAGGGQPSGNIVIANISAPEVEVQQNGRSAGNASILRASPASLITAQSLLLEVDHLGAAANGSIGTAAEPIRIAPYGGTTINFESHAHEFSPGIFIDAPVASTDLIIGGVPFFGGMVRGVQTVSGGPIEITVNGTLSQVAGTAVCGTGGGSGGPICAGPNPGYAPSDTVTLRANDMDLQRIVSGWDVNLMPLAGGNITLGSSGTGGSLHLSQSEIFQVDSFTLNIGEQGVSGDVTFVGNLTTPTLFGIRTGGKIESGAFTLTVGATGDGNIDLYAQTGIQLNVNAATLSAWNAGATGSINLAETSAGGGTLTLDFGVHPGGDSLRNDAPLGDITLFTTTRSIAVVNSITGLHDVALTAGGTGNVTIGAQPTPVIVSAGGDIYLNATGGMVTIQGGDTNSGSGPVRDASTTVHATGNVIVNAGGLTVAAGNAAASGSVTSAIADAELSAGGAMSLTLRTQGLTVTGGQASATAQQSGGAVATASASSRVTSGGVLGITVDFAGDIVVGGGNATARAFHSGSEGATRTGDNTATATANTTLSGGTNTNITLIGGNLVVAGGQATASAYKTATSGSNSLSGTNNATANANVMVKATSGTLTIDIGGGTMQVGGNQAYAHAYHSASGGASNMLTGDNTAAANANISFAAGNALTISGTAASILRVGADGGEGFMGQRPTAQAHAFKRVISYSGNELSGENQATATADLKLSAAGAGGLGVTVGNLEVQGAEIFAQAYHAADYGNMNTLAGDNTANANSEVSFKATDASGTLTIDVGAGPMTVTGATTSLPSDNTRAFKHVNGGSSHDLTAGDNTATAIGEVKFSAGNNLTVTAGSLTINNGGGAAASADRTVNGSVASGNQLGGTHTASATANISFTAGNNLTIDLGGGAMTVYGARADAWAYHVVGDGGEGDVNNNNTVGGNNTATAIADTSFTATGTLTVNAGSLSIYGARARAEAYKLVNAPSFGSAIGNTLSGTNTVTMARSNINISGASVALNLGTGSLYISGNSANAYANYASGSNYGNTLVGNHDATANSNITIDATGGALTVGATGGISINAGGALAQAYKIVYGSSNTVAGDNTATAVSNIKLSGTGITLTLGTAGLNISGDRASGSANHSVYGSMNTVSGNHTASATSNLSLDARGSALIVTAGGMSLADGGEGGAFARAYMYATGNNHIIGGGAGPAANTATANRNIDLSGTSITLDLGAGIMTISAARAYAEAYHNVASGLTNSLTGDHGATANSNISLTTGGALTVNATGGVTISGHSASANAYKHANGSSHAMAGNNTATANSNISLSGASVTLNLGAGTLNINGSSAEASAYHAGFGTLNNIGGNHVATANSNITLNATGGALTINAGGVTINASSAEASAYKYVPGTTNTVSGDNTATANSNIALSGASITLALGAGSLTINGSSASASAYHYLPGGGIGNILTGNHSATANSNITLAATGALVINATGGVTINGSSAEAGAYKYIPGNTNTVAGNNTATVNSNITLSGASVALNLGGGSLTINGSSASARAYYQVNGANNILSGAHNATANSNITVNATGGNLTIDAGSIAINGDSASARAYMYVNGNGGNTIGIAGPASNTATADATIRFTATGSQTITVAGGITASASISASAGAYHQINNGAGNNLNGNNTAIAKNGLLVSAGGTLTVAAGSLNVGSLDASASAYKYISGASSAPANTNQITGNNSATGTGLIKFAGAGISISVTGSLGLLGSYVYTRAYNQIGSFSNNNTLTGNNTAKAAANIVFVADNTLAIVAGSVTARASSASATAHNTVSGSVMTGNTVSGANSAIGDGNIRLSATTGNLTMNVNAGNVLLRASDTSAHAKNIVDAGNTVTATNTATGHGNVLVAAGADMTINVTSGNLTVQGDHANANTSGAGTNLADANANAGIFAIGVKTVNVSNTVFLTGGSATVAGPGATAAGFAMLDPGSLDLTAAALTLTPNAGSGGAVVMSAFGPINLTIGGSSTPLSSYAAPGNILGTGTLTSGDPLIIDISGTIINITDRFGLPPAFLAAGPGINVWTGIAGDFLWASGGNWSLGHEPNSFETAQVFDLSGTPTISILSGAHTPKAFQFFGDDIFSISGGSLTFTQASTISNGTLLLGGGMLTANSTLNANTLNLSGSGLLNGSGSVTVTNAFSQTGGTLNIAGNLSATQAAGNLAIANSFINAAAITFIASAGNISVQDASVNATGTLDVTASGNLDVTANAGAAMLQSTGLQTISANGITVQGAAAGANRVALITGNAGQNIIVGAGGITLNAGNGGTSNGAFIQQFGVGSNQTITVNGGGTVSVTGGGGTQNYAQISNQGLAQSMSFTAGGTLTLQGGSGVGGQNSASVQNQGPGATLQTISFAGGASAINATGGTVGPDNYAEIHANTGNQTITGNPNIALTGGASGGGVNTSNDAGINLKLGAGGVQTINAGTLALTGGAGGVENGAFISAQTTGQTQIINTTGSVTLLGGGGMDALVGIATDSHNLNVTLNAGGAVSLTGGTGGYTNYGAFAAIGAIGGFNANVTINGQAGITLTKGAGLNANAFIGTDTGTPTLTLKAGLGGAGNLALNDGLIGNLAGPLGNIGLQANNGNITQTTGGIRANTLTATASGNIALPGANQVSTFVATSSGVGDITFANAASFVAGGITAASGNVTLNSMGTVTETAAISATGLELLGAGGTFTLNTQNNAVTTLAGNTGTVKFRDNTGFAIGIVNTVGLTTTGNTTLDSTGTVSQSQAIGAAGLELLGAGGTYNLGTQNNAVTTLAGNTGTVTFRDDTGFAIGTVNSIGLTTTGNTTLQSIGGTVTQTQAIAAAGLELLGAGGVFNLNTQNNAITTLAGNTGTVKFRDNTGFAIGTVNTAGLTTTGNTTLDSTGTVTQSQALGAGGLELVGAGGTYNLNTQNNAVTTLAANTGTLKFRDDAGFDVGTVNATVGVTTSGNTTLDSTGTVTQSQKISASGLELVGAGGTFNLINGTNNVATIAANTGAVTYVDMDDLASGTVGATSGVTAAGAVALTAGAALYGSGVITGSTINLSSVSGMSVVVNSAGAGLNASNTGPTGNLVLTSTAPTFTVGGGGATFSNTAPGGLYSITAQNNMVLNGGTANDRQALFGAGNMLTVNGYTNATGSSVLMAGNNVTFNGGATMVSGALGILAGTIDVNTTVEGASIDVTTGALNVNGADFRTTVGGGGSFSGYVSGDINVSGGGRIYGDVDVLGPPTAFDSSISALTVGGTIFIDGAGSRIEAGSPTSIIVYFPLITEGGYVVNGVTGQVWDTATSTGFFAGGLPAELGSSLRVFYQSGLPSYVISAINTTIASINESTESPVEDEEQKDNNEKPGKDEKSISTNLKLQCN